MLRLRVNEILKQQHKSRYWLNNQMGMTYTNLRRIIDNETTSIRYDTLEKLCRVLNCSPSECTFRINGAPFPRQRCKRLAPAVRYPFVVTC